MRKHRTEDAEPVHDGPDGAPGFLRGYEGVDGADDLPRLRVGLAARGRHPFLPVLLGDDRAGLGHEVHGLFHLPHDGDGDGVMDGTSAMHGLGQLGDVLAVVFHRQTRTAGAEGVDRAVLPAFDLDFPSVLELVVRGLRP